jgi:hypothetical protein
VPAGAVAIPLVANHGEGRGHLDGRNGDRFDWKRIERPAPAGSLVIELRSTALDPAGNLWLVLYSENGNVLDTNARFLRDESPAAASFVVDPAPRIVLVRVQCDASDVAGYQLAVSFAPHIDWSNEDIPGPPDLPDVPPAEPPSLRYCKLNELAEGQCRRVPCSAANWDLENPLCRYPPRPPPTP